MARWYRPVARAGGGEPAEAFPGVQADVVMIAAGGEEGGGVAHPDGHLKAEHVVVEAERALQVGHLEMHVADPGLGMDRFHGCEQAIRWHKGSLILARVDAATRLRGRCARLGR